MTVRVGRYYADAQVQARIREYCGAPAGGGCATAAYVAAIDALLPQPIVWENATKRPTSALNLTWSGEGDLARSLLDRESLVFLFELDYMNPDAPAEPFTHPVEVMWKLEPAFKASRRVLESFGVWPFTLVTGRGYHFTGRIPLNGPVIDQLARVVPGTPTWVDTVALRSQGRPPCEVPLRVAQAWSGLGCVVEYLAHLVMAAGAESPIPLVFNGTEVGTGSSGRECVSIDFSYAGDPLDTRYVRCAFSAYQWHRFRPDIFGPDTATTVPPLAALPRGHRSLAAFLRRGRTLEAARRTARRGVATMPDVAAGVERVLSHYLVSHLAEFHRGFHEELRVTTAVEERIPTGLPRCGVAILERPNDLLLKPAHIQHLVRLLLARGWSAALIARLIGAAYQADHAWGDRWRTRMDTAARAEFDVRVFAGMVAASTDRLIDFNCVSAQEKGLCPRSGCPYDLRLDRERLTGARQ